VYFLTDIKIYFGIRKGINKMFNYKKIKKNILKHAPLNDNFPNVIPAKRVTPDWYKDATKLSDGNKEIKNLPAKLGFKYCSPFGDSLLSGYVIPLAVDIAVEQTEGGPSISWSDSDNKYLDLRPTESNPTLPTPNGYAPLHFTWLTQHMIKIPKGYSALITHPLNRFDLPFITLSGIIDGEFVLHNGNIPVYFNTKFEGIIKSGTPIIQVIPFKRESWSSEIDKEILMDGFNNGKKSKMSAFGWYKQSHWHKKNYE